MDYYLTSSDLQTSSKAISARGGFVHAVTLIPAAAACSVTLNDNASGASGIVLAKLNGVANGATVEIVFNHPVCANSGIYATVAGAAAAYIVHYSVG